MENVTEAYLPPTRQNFGLSLFGVWSDRVGDGPWASRIASSLNIARSFDTQTDKMQPSSRGFAAPGQMRRAPAPGMSAIHDVASKN